MSHRPLRMMCALLSLLLSAALLAGCDQEETRDASPLSAPTQAALSILIDQLGLEEHTALDVYTQLRRAGYDSEIRMAFCGAQENTLRVWTADAALTVVLDEAGLVCHISDGTTATDVAQAAEHTESTVDTPPTGDELQANEPSDENAVLRAVSLTDPVRRGKEATLQAVGSPGVEYDVSVRYASGESTAAGLVPITASADGSLCWTFRVSARVAPGQYPVTVSGGGETLALTLTVVE